MANEKTVIEELELRDLEDNSMLRVAAIACPELGNWSKPGIQIHYLGYIVNYEPRVAEQWAYQAKKAGGGPLYLESNSWAVHEDQFVKVYFVPGTPPKARVEAKTRSMDGPAVREYDLPFQV